MYIVDISGSMGEGSGDRTKFSQLQAELIASIDALLENAQIVVLAFESDTVPLLGKERWSDAGDRSKKKFIEAIRGLEARGGTNPAPAFTVALQLRPRPDAIYFMTDGIFDASIADRISSMNRGDIKIPIHTIAFGSDAAVALMQKIATDSGGTFTKVDSPR